MHVDSGPSMGSHLEAFSASEKNPFKPMKDLAKTNTPAPTGNPSGTTGGGTPTGNSNTSGTSGGGGGGGGTPASTNPGSGGGTTSKGGTTSTTPTTTKWFHYVADFSFGETGKKPKTHKGVVTYTLLPDESEPVVVFLGISSDNKSALFFLNDPGFDAQGEGKCNAKSACQFVTLSLSETTDEESFSAIDGSVSYDLKLLGIRREELGTGSQPTTPTTPKNGKALAATGAGVAAATDTAQSVVPEAFAGGPGVALEQK